MQRYIGFFIGLFLLSCQSDPPGASLIGAWKVDSTYTYYNRFSYTDTKGGMDWATYVYGVDGVMKEIKFDAYQTYFFDLVADSIIVRPTQGGDEMYFQILELNQNRLVLKKKKEPIFSGKNQERYEIRYLSKTAMPKEELIPFSDPRK